MDDGFDPNRADRRAVPWDASDPDAPIQDYDVLGDDRQGADLFPSEDPDDIFAPEVPALPRGVPGVAYPSGVAMLATVVDDPPGVPFAAAPVASAPAAVRRGLDARTAALAGVGLALALSIVVWLTRDRGVASEADAVASALAETEAAGVRTEPSFSPALRDVPTFDPVAVLPLPVATDRQPEVLDVVPPVSRARDAMGVADILSGASSMPAGAPAGRSPVQQTPPAVSRPQTPSQPVARAVPSAPGSGSRGVPVTAPAPALSARATPPPPASRAIEDAPARTAEVVGAEAGAAPASEATPEATGTPTLERIADETVERELPASAAPIADVAPAAAPAPGPVPVAEPPMRPRSVAVQSTVDRYRAAFNTFDAVAAQAVWPTVDARALARSFERLERQTLALDACAIAVTGTQATASCRGTLRYVPRVGARGEQVQRGQWTFRLREAGEAWVIEALTTR